LGNLAGDFTIRTFVNAIPETLHTVIVQLSASYFGPVPLEIIISGRTLTFSAYGDFKIFEGDVFHESFFHIVRQK
jgi:hypothetical protein